MSFLILYIIKKLLRKFMSNTIDESRMLLRELQTMLFGENLDTQLLFSKTLELDDKLNKASIDYNKYLNEIEKNKNN